MSQIRLLAVFTLLVATLARPAIAADAPSRLLQSVPASAPLVVHVRSVPELRANWEHTSYARMWAEPEVRAFFAPATKMLTGPDAQKAFSEFETSTGMQPADFIALFPGEFLVVMVAPPGSPGEEPSVVIGASLGDNRAKIEAAFVQAHKHQTADANETVITEEFQGETIHVTLKQDADSGTTEEAEAWVMVDDVLWMGQPKQALQQLVANWKRGGAEESITASPDFASIYQREPGAQAAFYLNIATVTQAAMEQYAAKATAPEQGEAGETTDEGEETGPAEPSMFEKMGLTPEVIVHALGLDALRGVYGTVTMDEKATAATFGLTWSEQRGLLRLFAFGDAPAPQPRFVPPQWPSVSSVRFKVSEVWAGITDSLRTANPMFEFMLAQQLAGIKQQLGIDLERDLFGSFGDEVVRAYLYPEDAAPGMIAGGEQLWAFSLVNAEALSRTLEAASGMAPMAAQKFTHREYLGHQIHTISLPLPAAGGAGGVSLSYAITPDYLFVDIGGASMIETAIQRLNGEGEVFWAQPEVVAAMQELPPGGSSFAYQDLRRIAKNAVAQLVQLAKASPAAGMMGHGEELELDEDGNPLPPRPDAAASTPPGLRMFIDPDAVPSDEVLMRHWSTSTGATYREPNGVRMIFRINNGN